MFLRQILHTVPLYHYHIIETRMNVFHEFVIFFAFLLWCIGSANENIRSGASSSNPSSMYLCIVLICSVYIFSYFQSARPRHRRIHWFLYKTDSTCPIWLRYEKEILLHIPLNTLATATYHTIVAIPTNLFQSW